MARAWDNLGLTLFRLDRAEEAQAAFDAEVQLVPEASFAHYNLGCALAAQRGKREQAIGAFERSIELAGGNVDAIHNLATLLGERETRDREREFELYGQALEVDPDYAPAHLSLGWFHQYEPGYQSTKLALHHYEEYVRLDKSDEATVKMVRRTIRGLQKQ